MCGIPANSTFLSPTLNILINPELMAFRNVWKEALANQIALKPHHLSPTAYKLLRKKCNSLFAQRPLLEVFSLADSNLFRRRAKSN